MKPTKMNTKTNTTSRASAYPRYELLTIQNANVNVNDQSSSSNKKNTRTCLRVKLHHDLPEQMICIGDDVLVNPTNIHADMIIHKVKVVKKVGSRNISANINAVYDSVRHVKPYVGRLEKLWMSNETKNIMCRIRWFLKKHDAAECMKPTSNLRIYGVRSKDVVLQSMNEDRDLIFLTSLCDENPVSTILGKVHVVYRPPICGVLDHYHGEQEEDQHLDVDFPFVCRYEMRMNQKSTTCSNKKTICIRAYNYEGNNVHANKNNNRYQDVSKGKKISTSTSANAATVADCDDSSRMPKRRRRPLAGAIASPIQRTQQLASTTVTNGDNDGDESIVSSTFESGCSEGDVLSVAMNTAASYESSSPQAAIMKEVLQCSLYLYRRPKQAKSRTGRRIRKHHRALIRRLLLYKFLKRDASIQQQLDSISKLDHGGVFCTDDGEDVLEKSADIIVENHPQQDAIPLENHGGVDTKSVLKDVAESVPSVVRKKRLVSSKRRPGRKDITKRCRRDRVSNNASLLEMSTPSPSSKSSAIARRPISAMRREKKSPSCSNAGDTLSFLNKLPKSSPFQMKNSGKNDSERRVSSPQTRVRFDSLMSIGKPVLMPTQQSNLLHNVTRKRLRSPQGQSEDNQPLRKRMSNTDKAAGQKAAEERKQSLSTNFCHSVSVQNMNKHEQSRLVDEKVSSNPEGEQVQEAFQTPMQRLKITQQVAYDRIAQEKKLSDERIEQLRSELKNEILKRDKMQKEMITLNEKIKNEEVCENEPNPDKVFSELCNEFKQRSALHDKVSSPSFFVRRPEFRTAAPMVKNVLQDLDSAKQYAKKQKEAVKAETIFRRRRQIRAALVRRFLLHKFLRNDFSAMFRKLTGKNHNFPPSFLAHMVESDEDDDLASEEDESTSQDEEIDDENSFRQARLQIQPRMGRKSKYLKLLPDRDVAASIMRRFDALDGFEKCGICPGCLVDDCGECASCLMMPRFGGKSTKKQDCVHRRCIKAMSSVAARNGNATIEYADSSDVQSLSDHEPEDIFESDEEDEVVQTSNLCFGANDVDSKSDSKSMKVVPRTAAEIVRSFQEQERLRYACDDDDDDESSDGSKEDNYDLDFL
mmetsp:Transcript_3009/g.4333  ORF Transcript_3009/g.4333 Transcript_3009/m.4333 type:complete len:1096 (-) Transcript_3009:18-3305(-)